MALWNTHEFGIRPRAVRPCGRRPVARRRPIRRPSPEALEGRCLLSTNYSITDIDVLPSLPLPHYWVAINNASPAQVVAGEGPDGQAFVWDSVHGLQDLGTLKNEANSASYGINDSGTVVGRSWTTTTVYKKHDYGYSTKTVENGFLWTASGGMSNLGSDVYPDAINNSGEMIGYNSLWAGKTWASLENLPGGTLTLAYGLNNDGQVVGYSMNNNSAFAEGYLWTPSRPNGASGTMIDLGSFDTTSFGVSSANAINGGGLVTGSASNADLYGGAGHAFVWEPSAPNATTGTMVDLGTLAINSNPSLSQSEGLAINSGGVVVGDSNTAGPLVQTDAVIWQPGAGGAYTMTDINNLIPSGTGWTLVKAEAINDAGLIVAFGSQNGGPLHAVLLTPQTTATALAVGATPGLIRPTAATPATSVRISALEPGGGRIREPIRTNPGRRAGGRHTTGPPAHLRLRPHRARGRTAPKEAGERPDRSPDVGGPRELLMTVRFPEANRSTGEIPFHFRLISRSSR